MRHSMRRSHAATPPVYGGQGGSLLLFLINEPVSIKVLMGIKSVKIK